MIVHVVLYRPKADATPDDLRALAAALDQAPRTIPAIRRIRLGRRLDAGPDYPFGPFPDLPFTGMIDFDDRSGLEAYLSHPFHATLARLFRDTTEASLVYDYELVDANELSAEILP